MAYEFKKLSDVNVIEEMKNGLNVLVEDGGEIVKLAANSMIPEDVALKSDIPEGLPEGAATHQVLVTDGEGTAKWEERTHYVDSDGTVHPLDPKFLPDGVVRKTYTINADDLNDTSTWTGSFTSDEMRAELEAGNFVEVYMLNSDYAGYHKATSVFYFNTTITFVFPMNGDPFAVYMLSDGTFSDQDPNAPS